jgi:Flp pilus assembly protein TadD
MANLGTVLRGFARVIYGAIPTATNEDAVRFLEKAAALNSQRVATHAALGRAYQALKQTANARTAYTRALALPSTDKADDAVKAKTRELLRKL